MSYKFKTMDDVLHDINGKYISFTKSEEKRNNTILHTVIPEMITYMKKEDPLFNELYKEIFYGGSYYDDSKIGKPNEFDLDLLLDVEKFAESAETILFPCNIPGFIHLKVTLDESTMSKHPQAFRKFETFLDSNKYVCTEEILNWMESVVQRAINCFDFVNGARVFKIQDENGVRTFKIRRSIEGPAVKLHILNCSSDYYYDDHDDIRNRNEVMTIDLVPAFYFTADKWPKNGFIENPVPQAPNFFIVPKKPKSSSFNHLERYWRLSFQQQESVLMGRNNNSRLKPTIRLLKRLRNTCDDKCIASYYIKTVVLHIAKNEGEDFWQQSLSYVFMAVLKKYIDYIRSGNIPYYWNKKYNLIRDVKDGTLKNIANRLEYMIKVIEKNVDKPETVASYLLPYSTYQEFLNRNRIVETTFIGEREVVDYIIGERVVVVDNKQSRCIVV